MKITVCDICEKGIDLSVIQGDIPQVTISYPRLGTSRVLDICNKCLQLIAEKSREQEPIKDKTQP